MTDIEKARCIIRKLVSELWLVYKGDLAGVKNYYLENLLKDARDFIGESLNKENPGKEPGR